MKMADSQLRTITIPGTPTNNPAVIAMAMFDRPMRVMVDNTGGVPCRIAFSSSSLGGVTSEGVDHFRLAAGAGGRVFILAPKQRLYAVAAGATGELAVATSDALPFEAPP
jgi:hypothetical protein